MDIIIDTKGQEDLKTKTQLVDSDDDWDFGGVEVNPTKIDKAEKKNRKSSKLFDLEELEKSKGWTESNSTKELDKTKKKKINTSKDVDKEEFYKMIGWTKEEGKRSPSPSNTVHKMLDELTQEKLKILSNKPAPDTLESISEYNESKKKLKERRKQQRDKTKGKQWFNLPATELTDEVKRDLEIIQMRSALDPKKFYKRNDVKALPKYFQIGKVVDSPLDYYSGRMTKKERKRTIVDELMADAEFAKYNKRKYKEIIEEKNKRNYKAHRHAKRLKGKKK